MTVKKTTGGYALFSKKTGRKLSKTVKSKDSPELKKREKQVQMYKNEEKYKKDHGGKSFLKKKRK
jgi:hypothetical protein